jgi:uncharacterized protein (TIGR02145 family)
MKNMKRLSLYFAVFIISIILFECEENQAPVCEIVSPTNSEEFDIGDIITIAVNAEDLDGEIADVKFYIDEVGMASVNEFPYNYLWETQGLESGSWTIKAIAKDNDGSSASDEIAVILNLSEGPPIADFSASATDVYRGEQIQFTDLSAYDPTQWQWNFGASIIGSVQSSEQNPTTKYSSPGKYTVSLRAMNTFGEDTEIKTDYISASIHVEFNPSISYDSVQDIDGNSYKTVIIGGQEWMAENLKSTQYADGSAIPYVEDTDVWDDLGATDEAYCWYKNSKALYADAYGAIYSWSVASRGVASDANPSGIQGVCPNGWHLPSDSEWKQLELFLGMSQTEVDAIGPRGEGALILKEAGTLNWNGHASSNLYGFTSLPSGSRSTNGIFDREEAFYWTSSRYGIEESYRVWTRELAETWHGIIREFKHRDNGYSVRCVKD